MNIKKYITQFLNNFLLLLLCFNNFVFAAPDPDLSGVTEILVEVTQVLLIVAAGICVGKVIHIGILYVSSVAADKSNAKSAILPWLVGTFLCFGAAVIGPAIIDIFKSDLPTNVLEY